jgi:hypothetical protein
MARAYVDYGHEAVAVIVIRDGLVLRSYRKHGNFPWIAISAGRAMPVDSICPIRPNIQGAISPIDHCEPHTWLGERDARNVDAMTDQLLVQNGHVLVLLHADILDDATIFGDRGGSWRDHYEALAFPRTFSVPRSSLP